MKNWTDLIDFLTESIKTEPMDMVFLTEPKKTEPIKTLTAWSYS